MAEFDVDINQTVEQIIDKARLFFLDRLGAMTNGFGVEFDSRVVFQNLLKNSMREFANKPKDPFESLSQLLGAILLYKVEMEKNCNHGIPSRDCAICCKFVCQLHTTSDGAVEER